MLITTYLCSINEADWVPNHSTLRIRQENPRSKSTPDEATLYKNLNTILDMDMRRIEFQIIALHESLKATISEEWELYHTESDGLSS